MDADHRMLLELLMRGQQTAARGDKAGCVTILKQLQDNALIHFQREEVVMTVCAYPQLHNHVQVHGLLIRQLDRLFGQLSRDELTADELVAFLGSWWINHIRRMDRVYAAYCQDKLELIEQTLEKTGLALVRKDSS